MIISDLERRELVEQRDEMLRVLRIIKEDLHIRDDFAPIGTLNFAGDLCHVIRRCEGKAHKPRNTKPRNTKPPEHPDAR